MRPDIISKLNEHIARGIKYESDAQYVFAQIRKLLEKEPPDQRPKTLWLYCHWAVHVNLTYDKTTLDLLQKLDRYIQNNIAGFIKDDSYKITDEEALFNELLHQDVLRKELQDAMKKYGIDSTICTNDKSWQNFFDVYSGLIEDGSLTANAESLNCIDKVVFKNIAPSSSDPKYSFGWDIHLKDGRTVKAYLHAHEAFDLRSITVEGTFNG